MKRTSFYVKEERVIAGGVVLFKFLEFFSLASCKPKINYTMYEGKSNFTNNFFLKVFCINCFSFLCV